MCQSTSFKEAQSTNSVNPELQSKGPHARNRNAPDSNRAGERLAHGAQLARHRLRFKSEMHTDSQMWQERDRETKRESESARERETERERERQSEGAREGGRERVRPAEGFSWNVWATRLLGRKQNLPWSFLLQPGFSAETYQLHVAPSTRL